MMDGVENGRFTPHAQKCHVCGRVMSRHHHRCLYCGGRTLAETAFDAVTLTVVRTAVTHQVSGKQTVACHLSERAHERLVQGHVAIVPGEHVQRCALSYPEWQ